MRRPGSELPQGNVGAANVSKTCHRTVARAQHARLVSTGSLGRRPGYNTLRRCWPDAKHIFGSRPKTVIQRSDLETRYYRHRLCRENRTGYTYHPPLRNGMNAEMRRALFGDAEPLAQDSAPLLCKIRRR